jgi:hypothetical protein
MPNCHHHWGLIAFSESGTDHLALPCSDHKMHHMQFLQLQQNSDKFSLSSFDDAELRI